MSLVVLNGFIYAPQGGGGLQPLLRSLGDFVRKAGDSARDAEAAQLSAAACMLADRQILGLRQGSKWQDAIGRGRSILSAVWQDAAEERRDRLSRGERCPEHDWECRVLIHAIPRRRPLIRLITEKRSIFAPLLMAIEGIRDYHYDGRIDGEPDFSRAEWERRYAAWKDASKPQLLLGGAPLSITAVEPDGRHPSRTNVLDSQPSLGRRAYALAKEVLQNEFIHRRVAELGGIPQPPADPLALLWRVMDQWVEFSATDEGKAALRQRRTEYAASLPERLTLGDLMEDLRGVEPSEPSPMAPP